MDRSCLFSLGGPDPGTMAGAMVLGTTAASEEVTGRAGTILGEEVVGGEPPSRPTERFIPGN